MINSNKPQANTSPLPPDVVKLSHPYPLPPPLPDSHLAHHSGTPPSSLSRTDSKGPTQGKKKWLSTSLPWESSVGLPLSCHYATTAVTCFSPFSSSHPLCYSPTSPTALTCTFCPTTSVPPLAQPVEMYNHLMVTQSLNA